MFFSIAKEIWENFSQTYSMKKDIAACYEIENKVFNTKQGSLSLTDYYGTLNGLWIKLDQYQDLKMTSTADFVTLTQFIERMRIFKFLSGLNSEFDPIWVQILGKEKLPSLLEVFYSVRGEETRRSVMLERDNSVDGSALAIGKGPTKGSFSSFGSLSQRLTVMITSAAIIGSQVILRRHVLHFMEKRRYLSASEDSEVPHKGVLIKQRLLPKV